jgi:nucleotide-binding universal stress UspA family protein
MDLTGRIIVGVDGSRASTLAAEWALALASRAGRTVDLVVAWQTRARMAVAPMAMGAPVDDGSLVLADEMRSDALSADAKATAGRVGRVAQATQPDVPIRTWAIEGPAAEVLADLGGPGDLLVVGPAGHGPVAGAVLGSVASRLIATARCPVVVVRDSADEG